MSSNHVPPSVQNMLTAADAIANPEARYAARRARMPPQLTEAVCSSASMITAGSVHTTSQ